MSDPIDKLRGLAADVKAREEQLRSQFKEFESQLKSVAADYKIKGISEDCLFETDGDGDACYGHLFFEDELVIAYRTPDDDTELAFRDDLWERTYSVQNLDKCNPIWLRALASDQIIESLLTSINLGLEEARRALSAGIENLSATANLPFRDLEVGLIDVATKLDFGIVIHQWQEAQSALGIDPPDAMTRANSFVETLCKHILHLKGKPLPNKAGIKSLYDAASKAMILSPEQQSSQALTNIGSGLVTLTTNIGTLRNHASTAHGIGPGSQGIKFSQARLAVNAAGVLATFLMDALLAEVSTPTTPSSR